MQIDPTQSCIGLVGYGEVGRILAEDLRACGVERVLAYDQLGTAVAQQHGRRRAKEMRESAETVRDIGLAAWSASGTAAAQAWMADLADGGLFDDRARPRADWRSAADRILATLEPED
ncbi:MAG: DUF1932 domain-containing protein [Luteimonas sp.]